jgi:heptosyltransferase III
LKNCKTILVIIQRSNGDVFLSAALINRLFKFYDSPNIDLLVNTDTFSMAKLLPHVKNIHQFSYLEKKNNKFRQEKHLFKSIYRKYDLSINLTSSDRSVFYSLIASKNSISAVEENPSKSWWKKILLYKHYFFDQTQHILINNLEPLNILGIKHEKVQDSIQISADAIQSVKKKLARQNVKKFIIFHPSAQYEYKVYPLKQRNELLNLLNQLNIPVIISGGSNNIDLEIKKTLPNYHNIVDFIGKTSLEEYFALTRLAIAYIGMDTLNMHIAAAENKPIFVIFGPTNISMWSPWSNQLKKSTSSNKPVQTYGKNTIFQSPIPCRTCGKVGCGSIHNKNEFTYGISPKDIFDTILNWLKTN